jgi:hypothetical protein
MSIHRVIERLETYVRESTWFPMGYRLISLDRVLELIEKMRSTLPEEVGRARVIANNKERVIREAQERAQAIVSEANSAHSQLIDQHEIVRRARTTAEIIMREAEEKAKKVRDGADAYAAGVLVDLHGRLEIALRRPSRRPAPIIRRRCSRTKRARRSGRTPRVKRRATKKKSWPLAGARPSTRKRIFSTMLSSPRRGSVSPPGHVSPPPRLNEESTNEDGASSMRRSLACLCTGMPRTRTTSTAKRPSIR